MGKQMSKITLINNDCIEAMKEMWDNTVDAIVTDPPYELGFMGKSWDSTGIAFSTEVWEEALRVLKPGGHLIAFSGSRTYHRMAVAIEDAGFEIRDQIMWVYGSGFPKSMNISKAIDGQILTGKSNSGAIRFTNENRPGEGRIGVSLPVNGIASDEMAEARVTNNNPATQEGEQWQGWGTALKPAHEPMVLARKPVVGTIANNVLTYGVGGLNIDASRVGNDGGGTNCTNRDENGNCVGHENAGRSTSGATIHAAESNGGRWPANFIHDGSAEVAEMFPETKATGSGKVSGFRKGGASENSVGLAGKKSAADGFSDSGSAARFFYCAKTSKRDRNEGLDGFEAKRDHDGRAEGKVGGDNPRNRTNASKLNHHPTVKPTSLMQYLVRLVTPPNGTVLDPFMGSGSTGKACAYEGFDFIGIDQSTEYAEIARARINFALENRDADI